MYERSCLWCSLPQASVPSSNRINFFVLTVPHWHVDTPTLNRGEQQLDSLVLTTLYWHYLSCSADTGVSRAAHPVFLSQEKAGADPGSPAVVEQQHLQYPSLETALRVDWSSLHPRRSHRLVCLIAGHSRWRSCSCVMMYG